MTTATDLRRDIYRLLDSVLETGKPLEIERKGHVLRISRVDSPDPLARIQPLPDLIVGDPADLEHVDWSGEWRP
ncbi:MAG: type II toxin-antitoxin system Phd/YefM family antitoxin [Proteobacteria bacterium]|nr:type II toxin-antitoxin system Phd/YefM family antitoxin [Pseudomonadota bacterium]